MPVVILDKNTSKLHNSEQPPVWTGRECPKHVQDEVYGILRNRIKEAGLAQLYALEKKVERHYNNGTLDQSQFAKLDSKIIRLIAKSECL